MHDTVADEGLINSQMGVGRNSVSSEGKFMFSVFISVGKNHSERAPIGASCHLIHGELCQ